MLAEGSRFLSLSVGSLGRRRKTEKRKSSTAASMFSTSGASVQPVDRKCSLIGKFIMDTDNRAAYMDLIKRNLPIYLNTAEKVHLKVNRNVLLVTDRTIWQNRVDKIPISLVIDCHVDEESPKICYFVNETINGRYQVLVFLCKTSDDAYKLVDNCLSRNKTLQWYTNSQSLASIPVPGQQRRASQERRVRKGTPPTSGQQVDFGWQYQPAREDVSREHSTERGLGTPSNSRKGCERIDTA